jgi:cyanoexosortase A
MFEKRSIFKHFDNGSWARIYSSIAASIPPPTLKNLWMTLCCLVITHNLIVFTNSQITGNAITALIVWGGAIICIEDTLEELKPSPSKTSLFIGIFLVLYSLYRSSRVLTSDSFLYSIVPLTGLGLLLIATPIKSILRFKDGLAVLFMLPLFVVVQILFARYASQHLSLLTANFVMLWLSILGIEPVKVIADTVFVNGGAVQVMHECNGFEMIMQMLITSLIFLIAFPLRSRIGKVVIFFLAPIIGFIVNSFRISLLAIFTSFNSEFGKSLFDFFHEQAGSLIFSGLAVFALGYLYLVILNRELPPLSEEQP